MNKYAAPANHSIIVSDNEAISAKDPLLGATSNSNSSHGNVNVAALKPSSNVEKIGVSLGNVSIAAFDSIRSYYSSPFFLDVVGMRGSTLGNIQLASRLWDACCDPTFGYFSDSINTRWGRRKPWLVAACVPLAVMYMLMWTTWVTDWRFYMLVFVGFETFCTMITVPTSSIIGEMSCNYKDAITLSAYRSFFTNMAMLFALTLHSVLLNQVDGDDDEEEKNMYILSALIWSALCVPTVLICAAFARDKSEFRHDEDEDDGNDQHHDHDSKSINSNIDSNSNYHTVTAAISSSSTPSSVARSSNRSLRKSRRSEGRSVFRETTHKVQAETDKISVKESFWQNYKHVASNADYWIIMSAYNSVQLAGGFYAATLIFYQDYYLEMSGEQITLLLMVQNIARASGVPVMNFVAKRIGKKKTMTVGLVFYSIFTISRYFVTKDVVFMHFILIFAMGFTSQSISVIAFSCVADIVDEDELSSGVRREGSFYSLMSFVTKLMASISLAMSSYMLEWAGYKSDDDDDTSSASASESTQTDEVLMVLRLSQSAIPFLFLIVGLIFAWRYKLDQKQHEEILAQLAERHRRQ